MRKFLAIGAIAAASLLVIALLALAAPAPVHADGLVKQARNTGSVPYQGVYLGVQAGVVNVNTEVAASGLAIDGLAGSSAIYGAQVGYDRRFGKVVLGVFGEFNKADAKFEVSPGLLSAKLGNQWTAGARAGLVVNGALPYVFVGHTWSETDIAFGGTSISSKNIQGWTGGAGIDLAVRDGWVAGLRYAYTRFDNEDLLGLGVLNLQRDQHAFTGKLVYQIDFLR